MPVASKHFTISFLANVHRMKTTVNTSSSEIDKKPVINSGL